MATKKFSLKDNPIFKSTVVPNPGRSEKATSSSDDTLQEPIKENKRAPRIAGRIFLGAAAAVLVAVIFLIYRGQETPSRSQRRLPNNQKEQLLQIRRRAVKPVEKQEEKRKPLLLPEKKKSAKSIVPTSPSSREGKTANIVKKKREKPGRKEWSLTAIIYNKTSSRAIINHDIVREGDILPGEETTVIKIRPDRVILSREGKTFTLRLGATIPREVKTGEKRAK